MKKLVSIILVLALCLSTVAAFAEEVTESVPSKTTGDLVALETEDNVVFVIDTDNEMAQEELQKLIAAPSIAEYFGDVVSADGTVAPLPEGVVIEEFFAVEVSGYDEEDGEVELVLVMPGPYEIGEEVMLLVGIPEGDDTLTWYAFEGVATAVDSISVTLTDEAMQMIQDAGTVQFAIARVIK